MSNYLRRERRAWGLTQRELAELLGCRCPKQLSRIERDVRPPSMRVLVASKILFGCPARRIFPRLYDEVEELVIRNAYRLHQRLEDNQSAGAMRKKAFLEEVLNRAVNRTKSNKSYAKKNLS